MKSTNHEKIKEMAKTMLYLDIKDSDVEGFIIHPYFQTTIFPTFNGETMQTHDLRNPSDLELARQMVLNNLNSGDDFWRCFAIINKPYRSALFKFCKDYFSEKDYANVLEFVWTSSENPNQDVNVSISEWIKFFNKANKKYLMSKEDYKIYSDLPEEIEIYRGVGFHREPYGLSWTNNKKTAEWFANRWNNKEAYMFKTKCHKSDVLAYFNGRSEDELVINIKNLKKSNIERIDLI